MAQIGAWEIMGLVAGSSVLAAGLNQIAASGGRWLARSRDRNFSRLYLALALEEYASACSDSLARSEAFRGANQNADPSQPNVPPLPPYPDTVDWKAMGLSLTNRLLSFRVEVESIRAHISDSMEHDEDVAVRDTREYSIEMGLKALKLGEDLRRDAGAPMPLSELDWSIQAHLESKQGEYEQQRYARLAARPQHWGDELG